MLFTYELFCLLDRILRAKDLVSENVLRDGGGQVVLLDGYRGWEGVSSKIHFTSKFMSKVETESISISKVLGQE